MTDRDPYLRGPGPRQRARTVQRPVDPRCEKCGGTAWIEDPRDRLPVVHCDCMTSEETTS